MCGGRRPTVFRIGPGNLQSIVIKRPDEDVARIAKESAGADIERLFRTAGEMVQRTHLLWVFI